MPRSSSPSSPSRRASPGPSPLAERDGKVDLRHGTVVKVDEDRSLANKALAWASAEHERLAANKEDILATHERLLAASKAALATATQPGGGARSEAWSDGRSLSASRGWAGSWAGSAEEEEGKARESESKVHEWEGVASFDVASAREALHELDLVEKDVMSESALDEGKNGVERAELDEVRSASRGARWLSFADAFLGDAGCLRVCERFRDSSVLQHLDLKGNCIGLGGAEALADLVRHSRSLLVLTLEWNAVGSCDAGVRALASALERNSSLTELDLRNNCIGPEGGVALARALRGNSALRVLDLRWNELGSGGGHALCSAVGGDKGNHSLLELRLTGNTVGAGDLAALDKALQRNRHPDSSAAAGAARLAALGAHVHFQQQQQQQQQEQQQQRQQLSPSRRIAGANKNAFVHVLNETSASEDAEDSIVFAERIVGLELEARAAESAAAAARRHADEQSAARAETVAQLTKALAACDELGAQLAQERAALSNSQQATRDAQARADAAEGKLGTLKASLTLQASELGEAQGALREQRAAREALEARLAAERGDKLATAAELAKERQRGVEVREQQLRAELAHQASADAAAAQARAALADAEARLAKELKAHAADSAHVRASAERERKAAAEAWHAREAELVSAAQLAAREAAATVHVSEAEAERRVAAAREEAAALLAEQRARHAEELQRAEQRHRVELKAHGAAAAERAVEAALKDAVRAAVDEAAHELEQEHKRSLWRREKEIHLELKAEAQKRVDAVLDEKRMLEEQLQAARQRAHDAEARHAAHMAQLQDRMRTALADAFKGPP